MVRVHFLLNSLVVAIRRESLEVAVAGYDELPGKCTGRWIEVWGDGHFAHYGEDHHISSVDDCADMCDQHSECAGFYVKNGKCSHWRSGSVSATPKAGHTCYVKQGGGTPAHAGGSHHVSASCDAVPGYAVQAGKCSGRWIEVWGDGHFAHYGEDHHISGLSDCADVCDSHSECSGFYTKNGKCSHWRSGSLSARPAGGHCCYSKVGGSLLELSDTIADDDEEMSWEEVNVVFEDETLDESTGARRDLVEDFLRFRRNGNTRRLTRLCHPEVRMEIWESVWSPTVYEGRSGVRQFVRERPYSEANDNCDHSHDTTVRRDRENDGFRINWQMKLGWSCITMYTRYEFLRHNGEWKISKIVTGH